MHKARSVQEILENARKAPDSAATQFLTKVLPLYVPQGQTGHCTQTCGLPRYPVVFHEWFLATWPEPSAWLSSRLEYGRTSAVMAMVGSILGYASPIDIRYLQDIVLNASILVSAIGTARIFC